MSWTKFLMINGQHRTCTQLLKGDHENKDKQAGAELGKAQPELGLKAVN